MQVGRTWKNDYGDNSSNVWRVSNDKLLLRLDPFDIFNLWQILNEYVTERQFKG